MQWVHDPNCLVSTPSECYLLPIPCELTTPVSAWDEIHEVFGDGHDYDWALVDDDEPAYEEEQVKPEMKYQDVRLPYKRVVSMLIYAPRCSNLLRFELVS